MLADEPLEGRNPRLVLFDQISGDCVLVQRAGLEPLNPDADQISRQIMSFRQAVERLAGDKLLRDLALELEAMGAVVGHGLLSFESPATRSIVKLDLSGPTGPLQIGVQCGP